MNAPLLSVRALGVETGAGRAVLRDVSLDVAPGASLGIVGSSGAGKSTFAAALLRLLPSDLALVEGSSIRFEGTELATLPPGAMRAVRGRRIALVPQEPLLALDPAMRIGRQLAEAVVAHALDDGAGATGRAEAMLARVGLTDPRNAMHRFPHELSGGMRQRVLIAAALVLEPALLVADEPTTALDPTLQAQVLDLIDELRAATGTALVLISHDLAVVGERCADVVVLDGGRVAEAGRTRTILEHPASDAARRLATARLERRTARATRTAVAMDDAPLLDVQHVSVRYEGRHALPGARWPAVEAVREVSLCVARGEAVGVVGESGCGKTSLARAILRLGPLAGGRIILGGVDVAALPAAALRQLRRRMQYIPQDAGASLTPHRTAAQLVAEGLEVHGIATGSDADRRARALLERLALPARVADARPTQLSTGERQRVAIARALGPGPELLICDEPVASVDAVTRAGLLDLLDDLRREQRLALLLISHDLDAVRRIASRLVVMYLGRVVESGTTSLLADEARMPYLQALLAAEPTGDPAARAARPHLRGDLPAAGPPPAGCPFHPRCPHPARDAQCTASPPALRTVASGHEVACWKA